MLHCCVSQFNVFAFEFFDWNVSRLGWYRLSCQHFEDAAWPVPEATSSHVRESKPGTMLTSDSVVVV